MTHLTQLAHVIERNRFLILDTETTGIDRRAQIVQIAMVDAAGRVLINSLVKPSCPIPPRVTAIHGISDADVVGAPTWNDLWMLVKAISAYRDIVAYNADFDIRLIRQTFEQTGAGMSWPIFSRGMGEVVCAMRAYAEHYGQRGYNGYRWQKLGNACMQQNIHIENAHSALGDCLMTLALVKRIVSNG
ncbi:MAG TPA: 3'-5' exonuclease [Aggregatilineales bacterium]|nr:3'-5' exonuclease [Aggregatilineales bacterium]